MEMDELGIDLWKLEKTFKTFSLRSSTSKIFVKNNWHTSFHLKIYWKRPATIERSLLACLLVPFVGIQALLNPLLYTLNGKILEERLKMLIVLACQVLTISRSANAKSERYIEKSTTSISHAYIHRMCRH